MPIECITADDFLAVEQRLTLHVASMEEAWPGRISAIEPIFLAIEILPAAGVLLPQPQAGMPVHASIPHGPSVYRFDSVYQSTAANDSSLWYINKPQLLESQQLRRFVRVPASLPARVRLPNEHGGLKNPQETVTLNISGGGVCFVAREPVPLKSCIGLSLAELPNIGELNLTADVVRCTPVSILAGRIYHIGVSLERTISRALQDRLIRSIFSLQRRQLAQGVALT